MQKVDVTCKLTPAVAKVAIELAGRGHFRKAIAAKIGVTASTLSKWIRKGEAGKEPYAKFARDFRRSESESEATALEGILSACHPDGRPDWKAQAWYLERRYPETYAQRKRVEAEAEMRITSTILERLRQKLPSETLRAVLDAIDPGGARVNPGTLGPADPSPELRH